MILVLTAALTLAWGVGQVGAQTDTEAVRLVVEAEPGVMVSRLSPPVAELGNPFKAGEVLAATVDGEPSPDDPDYYARLKPVTWRLSVPEGTAPGPYLAEVRATFSLCSKTLGVCFTDEQKALATVQVGDEDEATVIFRLRQPE